MVCQIIVVIKKLNQENKQHKNYDEPHNDYILSSPNAYKL